MNEQSLTENGVIYLSASFEGPFVLQAFTVRKLPSPAVGLQMCLTDGRVYIGAKFNSAEYPEVQDYWLVQITAKFISQTTPILIKTLQVVSTYPRKLLGTPPCNLTDHFNREIARGSEQAMGDPSKKVKYSNSFGLPLLKNSDSRKPAEKDKNSHFLSHYQSSSKRQESKLKVEAEKPENRKTANNKKLRLTDSDEECQTLIKKQEKASSSNKKPTNVATVQIDHEEQSMMKNCLISDLFERRTGWVILCRVNYINRVECSTGLYAKNFMLADEEGDEIKCVYFENHHDTAEDILEIESYYSFSNGEITRGSKNEGGRELQINFDINSTITKRNNVEFELNLSKVVRIHKIPDREPGSEVNVVGIIKAFKQMEQKSKSKIKYSATICDPESGYEIDLVLFLHNFEKPPEKGSIGILHNYQLFRQPNIYRLNSNYRSYFRKETVFKDELTRMLKKFRDERRWENLPYKNLSLVAFSVRTIQELRQICRNSDDEKFYSLIDCWPCDISKKKYYNACRSCKKVTQKKHQGRFFCANCQRDVETLHCHTLTACFSDYSGSVSIDVIGEHAETLLEKKSDSLQSLTSDKQSEYLESLRYKNITIKIKTEKKDRKEVHSVWAIEISDSRNVVKEIKRRMKQSLKMSEEW